MSTIPSAKAPVKTIPIAVSSLCPSDDAHTAQVGHDNARQNGVRYRIAEKSHAAEHDKAAERAAGDTQHHADDQATLEEAVAQWLQ
jgi:hypothetical protein